MGQLHSIAVAVIRQLEARYVDDPMGLIRAKGELASRTGFLVALVGAADADDPDRITRLKEAAAELGIAV